MAFQIRYPDSSKRAKGVDNRNEAINEALVLADTETVEVWELDVGEDGETMLARYEKRAEPLYSGDGALAPQSEPEPEPEEAPAE